MGTSAFVLIVRKELVNNSFESKQDNNKYDLKKEISSIEGVDAVYLFEKNESTFDAIVKISTSSINSLHKIVIGTISRLPFVKETKTMIIIET